MKNLTRTICPKAVSLAVGKQKALKIFLLAALFFTVNKASAQTWTTVGGVGLSAGEAQFISMAIDGSGNPYIAYQDWGDPSYKCTVRKYSGGSWADVGSAGFSASLVGYTAMATNSSGTVYAAYSDWGHGGRATVMMNNGGSWTPVGAPGFSAGESIFISLVIDGGGNLYVAYSDAGNSKKAAVMKYDGSTWGTVGSTGLSTGEADYPSLAIDGNGNLYLAYSDNDNSKKATVIKYDGSSWATIGASLTTGRADYISIAVDANNVPYLGYSDINNSSKASVIKYNGSSWATVGSAGFSAGGTNFNSLVVDGYGLPCMTFMDAGNGNKATVMRYDGSNWIAIGGSGISAGVAVYTTLAVKGNTLYLGYRDLSNSDKATVKKIVIVPTITSVGPSVGYPLSSVTITGTNFNTTTTNNIVYFGATKATVTAATATSLTVTVPTGATYMPVTVENLSIGLMAFSQFPFLPTYNNSAYAPGMVNLDPKVDFVSGTTPYGVAIGDLDGDGLPDMVASNYSSSTISVYHSTSSGGNISFDPKADYATGVSPWGIKVADIDGDGKLDIIVANSSDGSFSVFRNTSTSGAISFAPRINISTPISPQSVTIGDIDGDGRPDILTGGYGSDDFSVFLNTGSVGTISFGAATNFTASSYPRFFELGDFDGDGKPDVATSNFVSNNVSVFLNTSVPGTASFAAKTDLPAGSGPQGIAVGDLDGDGKPDIAVTNRAGNTIGLFHNTGAVVGTVSFDAMTTIAGFASPSFLTISDIDGDGKGDLAVVNNDIGAIGSSVLRNTSISGTISFAAKMNFATGDHPFGITAGDLNGDNKPEIIVANANVNNISILKNDPLSYITGATTICAPGTTTLSESATNGVWSTPDVSVATIDASGVVTGVGTGTAVISYTVIGGTVTTTVTINAGVVPIAGNIVLCTGAVTSQLSDNGSPSGTWSSSNGSVASIGLSTGLLISGIQGTTTITYKDACGIAVTTATVNATPASITGIAPLCPGGFTLSLANASTNGTWSSSSPSVASVDVVTGLVTSGVAGSTTITYNNGCGTATLVVPVAGPPITGVVSVQVNSTTVLSNINAGGLWSSSSPANATVTPGPSGGGVVSGVLAGRSVITYAVGTGCTATTTVTVYAPVLCVGRSVIISDNTTGGTWSSSNTSVATVVAGVPGNCIVTGAYAAGAIIKHTLSTGAVISFPVTVNALLPIPVTPGSVCQTQTEAFTNGTPSGGTWASSNNAIATIVTTSSSAATVRGVMPGNVTMTFVSAMGCMTAKEIIVNPTAPITGASIICTGQPTTLSNAVAGGTWSSSNSGMVTVVSGTGVATGVAAGSTASIKYSWPSGCMVTYPVVINQLVAISTAPSIVCQGQTLSLLDGTAGGGTWSSNNVPVASVTPTGTGSATINGGTPGSATITFTTLSGCKATKDLTTAPTAAITGVTTFCKSVGTTLSNTVGGGAWSSSNTNQAVISPTGVVTGRLVSYPYIYYTTTAGCSVSRQLTISACREDNTTGTVNPTAGVNDINIFPNPNKGEFTINGTLATTDDREVTFVVTDMLGQVIYKNNAMVHNGSMNEQVKLNGSLANGMYMLQVQSGGENKVFHFVIGK